MTSLPSNDEILRVVGECLPTKTISPELAAIFIQLTQRMANKPTFRELPDREVLVREALVRLHRMWYSFDPSKARYPFAYFTQCIHGSFLATMHRIKQDTQDDKAP